MSADQAIKDHALLREYTFTKGQVGFLLKRSAMPNTFLKAGPRNEVVMRSNGRSLILYMPQIGELIEHRLDDPSSLIRWQIPKVSEGESFEVKGIALSEAGDVFASVRDVNGDLRQAGIFKLSRDLPNQTSWEPVGGMLFDRSKENQNLTLLGTEGDSLVYLSHFGRAQVKWSKIQKVSKAQ